MIKINLKILFSKLYAKFLFKKYKEVIVVHNIIIKIKKASKYYKITILFNNKIIH